MYAPETAVVSIPEEALQQASYVEFAPLLRRGIAGFDAIRVALSTRLRLPRTGRCRSWAPCHPIRIETRPEGKYSLTPRHLYQSSRGLLQDTALLWLVQKAARSLARSLQVHRRLRDGRRLIVKSLGGACFVFCTAPYSQSVSEIIPTVGLNGTVTLVSAAVDGKIQVGNLVVLNMNRAALRRWRWSVRRIWNSVSSSRRRLMWSRW
ncbi:uncharacterized protein B0H18DRAFT_86009 [Fomitopsis serialis]|uniref:uncharacterized protein n=1 Tax=Fomitopsis serialis TaxID=139415 RepID=UPI002008CF6C|nr:uncharacterized protein B0H18DRAFT_86009 [Neoantrodia serialis]KAH9931497.1 hypothetical protein B0H18DRAFT_86009 [Neoantrodia serialis]